MQLFHERAEHRSGPFAAADEEECFTALGRKTGVFLTSEPLHGPTVISGEVVAQEVAPFDVSGDDRDHRVFVVPSAVCCDWAFE